MYPKYRYFETHGSSILHEYDIAGIRSLYGKSNTLSLKSEIKLILKWKEEKKLYQRPLQKLKQK